MSNLFAAEDASGNIRFVGDVPRGLACGCFCPTCHSPLIARQGNLNEWHFSHEAGQERPECLVGAVNLLRRLAIERTMQHPPVNLADYSKTVQIPSIGGALRSVVTWPVSLEGAWTWDPGAGHGTPVGNATISPGATLDLYIDIGEEAANLDLTGKPEHAALMLWVAGPTPATPLRTREQAIGHIDANSRLFWRRMPDLFGKEAAAMAELHHREKEERARHQQLMDDRSRLAGQRWAQIRNRLDAGTAPGYSGEHHAVPSNPHAPGDPAHSNAEPKPESYPWAPEAKPNASFSFYKLKDGSAWVIYRRADDGCAIAPWGTEQETEGWDEALPPSVGVPDIEARIYRADDSLGAMMFFRQSVDIMRTSSDPEDFIGL